MKPSIPVKPDGSRKCWRLRWVSGKAIDEMFRHPRQMTMSIRCTAALILFSVATGTANGQDAGTIAFPDSEGYGRFAQGGRGGDVFIVANLNDSGEGSLRKGIESAKGARTIVFAVSGTIALRSPLEVENSCLTIAGQTAPGDGICIKDYGLKFSEVNDVIMRYIRIRLGDQNKGSSSGADCITSSKISDVIFDHISAGWGIDAIHDNRGGGNFTLQWSIYGETLHDSIHYEKLPHSKLGSFRETTKNISLHHNLLHSTFPVPNLRRRDSAMNEGTGMKNKLHLILTAVLVAAGSISAAERPNILFVITEQNFADVMSGVMGDRYVKTPNLDALAKRGMRFDCAYAPNPICVPARNSIFSGHYPFETGLQSNAKKPLPSNMVQGALPPGESEVPECRGRMLRTDQHKYAVYDLGDHRESLIDMKKDPHEMRNLARDPAYKDVLKAHQALLRQYAAETGDDEAVEILLGVR